MGLPSVSLDGKDLYGDSPNNNSRPWRGDVFEYTEDNLKNAVERNHMTEQGARTWGKDYNYKQGHCNNRSRLNS